MSDDRRVTGPKTVVRPPTGPVPPSPARPGGDVFAALARPLIEVARAAERAPKPDSDGIAAEVRRLIADFETGARRAGVPPDAVLDARDALIALIDARARSNPALPERPWTRALAAALPLGPGTTAEGLQKTAAAAAKAGPPRRDLARFLGHCLEAVQAARPARAAAARSGRVWQVLVLLIAAGVIGWVSWAEWRYRERLLAQLPDVDAVIAANTQAPPQPRAAALDGLAAAVAEIERAAPASPAGLVHLIGPADPGRAARRAYARAATALLPAPLWDALDFAVATEGDPDALYDTLRARAILDGEQPWQPEFLAGWIADRAASFPDLAGLARHLAALPGPAPPAAAADPELLQQARGIAAEGGAPARAFLELARSDGAAGLPEWSLPAAVPGLAPVLVRRSGLPLARGVAGLYTEGGWAYARDTGVAAAIARAAEAGQALAGAGGSVQPEEVLDLLQKRTLEAWNGYLADLRVKPFTDQPSAVLISGTLGTRDSPLATLIREVWRQAGGDDRTRSHPSQLRVAAEFGPAIQFVEQGRMAEVSRLFASLNVALAELGANADLGHNRLMDVQAQATSIATLQQAPPLVEQIIEDVLAQTAASSAVPGQGGRPEMRLWQAQIASACASAIAGRYPFADGPDADPAGVAALFSPGGLVTTFFRDRLAPLIDMDATPWRWKPEARLGGFTPESAAFFERVAALSPAYFAADGLADTSLTLEALAQRGAADVALGGIRAPVVTTGSAAALRWPGPKPDQGFSIEFDGGAGGAKTGAAGPWGLIHILDGLRLRPRDDGKRFLIDVQLGSAQAFLQMTFASAANPVAARPLLRGLVCPTTL